MLAEDSDFPASDGPTVPPPDLVCFGNPLLDIIVDEQYSQQLIEKYNFEINIAQEVDTIKEGIYEEVIKLPGTLLCGGGCSLNTARVYQWLAQVGGHTGEAAVLGGVGADQGGSILQKFLGNAGVLSRLTEHSDLPTGHCIALIQGPERTLVANLGAANHFELGDLHQDNLNLLEQAQVIYVEGYFLMHSPEVALELANTAQKQNKTFVFNLCGEYVCEDDIFVQNVVLLLPFINYLFGNRSEFSVFLRKAKSLAISSCILQKLMEVHGREKSPPLKEDDFHGYPDCLTAVVTEGSESVSLHFIGEEELKSISVPVHPVPQSEIKDTIAAGDSFIAGFVFTLVKGGTLHHATHNATWTAQMMIRQAGSSLPSTKPCLPHQQLPTENAASFLPRTNKQRCSMESFTPLLLPQQTKQHLPMEYSVPLLPNQVKPVENSAQLLSHQTKQNHPVEYSASHCPKNVSLENNVFFEEHTSPSKLKQVKLST